MHERLASVSQELGCCGWQEFCKSCSISSSSAAGVEGIQYRPVQPTAKETLVLLRGWDTQPHDGSLHETENGQE